MEVVLFGVIASLLVTVAKWLANKTGKQIYAAQLAMGLAIVGSAVYTLTQGFIDWSLVVTKATAILGTSQVFYFFFEGHILNMLGNDPTVNQ